MKTSSLFIILITFLVFFNSCVSLKKYKALNSSNEVLKDQNRYYNDSLEKTLSLLKENTLNFNNCKNLVDELVNDTTQKSIKIKTLTQKYADLSAAIDLMSVTKNKEIENKAAVIAELQRKLDEREKGLDLLAAELEVKRIQLEETTLFLKEKEKQAEDLLKKLDDEQKKLKDMESLLSSYQASTENIRLKVSDALLGFEKSGLSIKVKNGKVYVSLDENLLFETGSTKIDKKGEEALKNLAKVLETNKDINVMIEGHTDNVPYVATAGCIKNNWELSVLRACSITDFILKNAKIDPKRLVPAGRADSLPVDNGNTKEARAKNRRTEIILTPKLDELFKIIGTN